MRHPSGWRWSQRTSAPDGWHWWNTEGRWVAAAEPADLLQIRVPTSLICKVGPGQGTSVHNHAVRLRLADGIWPGQWLRAWFDGVQAWALFCCNGPSPRKQRPRKTRANRIHAAVQRGGGQVRAVVPHSAGWEVSWERDGAHYQSLVDPDLNVLVAGFCLSGQDQLQDLTSLVSLTKECL